MLAAPTPTPLDLRWRMLGVPVRVHPTFWLFSAMFGWMWVQLGFVYVLVWIGCTFVSFLLHELAHAFTSKAFGEPAHVVLYSMGGLAMGNFHHLRGWQRIAISLAGPAANFILFGIALAVDSAIHGNLEMRRIFRFGIEFGFEPRFITVPGAIIGFIKMTNLFWGLFNLLPVYPLDGGQVAREVCIGAAPRQGLKISLVLSLLVAVGIAIYSLVVKLSAQELWYPSFGVLRMDPLFNLLIFGLLAFTNIQMLIEASRADDPWERDRETW